MLAQFMYPPTTVSTDVAEFESYLRDAAEFFGKPHACAFLNDAGTAKKMHLRANPANRRLMRRAALSSQSHFRK